MRSIMASIKRLAKENFAKALENVKRDFSDLMYGVNGSTRGLGEFGDYLLKDVGFEKSLHKAQLKFNDMVDDYLFDERSKTNREDVYFILRDAGNGKNVFMDTAREVAMDFLGITCDIDFDNQFTLDGTEHGGKNTDLFLFAYKDSVQDIIEDGIPNKDNLTFEINPNTGSVSIKRK